MKNIITIAIIFSTLISSSCSSQKTQLTDKADKKSEIEKIELTEQTRGTDRKITFTPLGINVLLNGNLSNSEIPYDTWRNIARQANSINLSKLSSYQAPTTGRFSDRALSSTIIITLKGKAYQSSGFDAGAPPKELKALYQLLKK